MIKSNSNNETVTSLSCAVIEKMKQQLKLVTISFLKCLLHSVIFKSIICNTCFTKTLSLTIMAQSSSPRHWS